ncbi:MAG TPA: nickel-dependent hydrogenase large subunit [bacterium]|nr:nickel-dependent hydrogenase large subunit [bacterium]HOL47542.1 nickel-dependent hydrogenase large subunit [bacterium]HPQ19106.1 nickel-dependent hydrogenase large subunit [bacterium]
MKTTKIPIGPYHPLLEEPECFTLYVEGEKVIDVELSVGWNHRAIEKITASKNYDQGVFVVERICGICSTSHPFAYVQAAEEAGNVKVPQRAHFIRTIIGELERIHSHLLWVGLAGHFIGYNTVFMWGWKWREPLLELLEMITGNRNHYAMFKVGGVRRDIDVALFNEMNKRLDVIWQKTDMITKAVLDDPVLHARLKGIGVLSKEDALNYCVVGPTARASGVFQDIRYCHPYAAYNQVEWKVIVQNEGDVFAKAVVRLLEIFESIKIIKECLKKMPEGEIDSRPEKMEKGDGIGVHEAPRGEVFHFIRSNGDNVPERVKIRAPSFMNIPSFKATCMGEYISDVALITAAVDPCYCCTERMIKVIDKEKNNGELTFNDLIKLSHNKTRKIMEETGKEFIKLENI